jgi:hypothetical protein
VAAGAGSALLGGPERLYVAVREGADRGVVDVVAQDGTLVDQLAVAWPTTGPAHDGTVALAAALLHDATGHPPRPATVSAFADDVLDHLPTTGFALTSSEVCAWLLLRAIERTGG